ncbi:cupin domain-containing protein [Clostridiaceae bacterium AF29-16BH]|nr:cupin domain-containing protein [Clostridiaceae bacterium AF29-16BH]
MKCIVLAGGSGDRLWPLSRKNYPKQFIHIKENRSLFQETIARNIPFCEEFYIITSNRYANIVEGQLQVFQGLRYRCFYEEEGKKTAPAVAIACLCDNRSEDYLVVSTDHMIEGGDYKGAIAKGREYIPQGKIVCLGIPAWRFEPGYGYFRQVEERTEFRHSDMTEEIPTGEKWYYDTGILLFNGGDFLHELSRKSPALYAQIRECVDQLDTYERNVLVPGRLVEELEPVSIGRAVTSVSDKVLLLQADFKWRRIMTLESLDQYYHGEDSGRVIRNDCENVSVMNEAAHQLVVANGLEDVIIVNTADAVYVSRKSEADQIKSIIRENYEKQQSYFDEGTVYYTPWGIKETIHYGDSCKVKKITIFPGKELSRHVHKLRTEHWSVISGVATIQLDEQMGEYGSGESISVPMGTPHQIANRGTEDLVVIEVSVGELEYGHGNDLTRLAGQSIVKTDCDEIVRMEPAFKDNLWGGTRLRDVYGKKCDYDIVAESWELSTHKAGQSIVATGKNKGLMLGEYINRFGRGILGWKCDPYERFPLLIKFIDSRESLSIQVHPGDDYALQKEDEYGKNELWYVVDCEPESYLYCGFSRDTDEAEVRRRIEDGTLTEILNKIPVKKGDSYFIENGTVHAIGPGVLICEIQQSSNVTYRLYDYQRRDKYGELRELHIDKAMEVTNFHEKDMEAAKTMECKYFSIEKSVFDGEVSFNLDDSSFRAFVVLEGSGQVSCGEESLAYRPADCFFVPAGKKTVAFHGCGTILKVQV